MEAPDTRYAKTPDGLSIAYQVVGGGPIDIAFLPFFGAVDLMWDDPCYAHALERLSKIGRLICCERRGLGVSDAVPLAALPTPEAWSEDVRTILDAVGSTSAVVICNGSASYMGLFFAATHPERTRALVLADAAARTTWAEDYPIGLRDIDMWVEIGEQVWGTEATAYALAPSRANDATFAKWAARWQRAVCGPAMGSAFMRWIYSLDMRGVLPAIRTPTLVLQREDNAATLPREAGQFLADNIAGARYIELPGNDVSLFTDRADEMIDHIEEFVTGVRPRPVIDRALSTVLFTDVVGSTAKIAEIGDDRWQQLLGQHDVVIETQLSRYRGRKITHTGDGVLATFDGPARAVHCARDICEAVRPLGIEVRAGLHTGEVELRGESIGGIAVHIGQRVCSLAGPSEVLVSRTVTDLGAGSGLGFVDRGEHELKGIPGTWSVYRVA